MYGSMYVLYLSYTMIASNKTDIHKYTSTHTLLLAVFPGLLVVYSVDVYLPVVPVVLRVFTRLFTSLSLATYSTTDYSI